MKQYRATWRARVKQLKKDKVKSEAKAAKLMVAQSKSMAPRKTGATLKGIKARKKKESFDVESWVAGQFKQNMWTNQTAPFRSPNMNWNERQPTVYGDGSHRTTGTPRWFHFAILRTRKEFPRFMRKNTLKTLRLKM